jgi:hypothetical protein
MRNIIGFSTTMVLSFFRLEPLFSTQGFSYGSATFLVIPPPQRPYPSKSKRIEQVNTTLPKTIRNEFCSKLIISFGIILHISSFLLDSY